MKILDVPQSGSVNGVTSSRNRYGQYRRSRAVPVQPRTSAQLAIRGMLALASQTWRTMADSDRAGWDSYAQSHPRRDSLGQQVTLTGAQVFCGLGSFVLRTGGASVPTSIPSEPDFTGFLPGVAASTSGDITLTGYVRPTVGQIAVFMSLPKSPGVSFFGQGRLVYYTTGTASTAINLITAYTDRFGAPGADCKVQLVICPFDPSTGIRGTGLAQTISFNP